MGNISFGHKTVLLVWFCFASYFSGNWGLCVLLLTACFTWVLGTADPSGLIILSVSLLLFFRGVLSSLGWYTHLTAFQVVVVHVLFFFYVFLAFLFALLSRISYVSTKPLHALKLYVFLFVRLHYPLLLFYSLFNTGNFI